ncbi:MAG: ATP-binding protein [Candidatus Taylorbacteria bacterium]|nr:ATP-binding protein [Candidatus Taylorbacteria bacterium]
MAEKDTQKTSYTAEDIYVLEGLEPVRKRPGMYIGSTGPDGVHHLLYEIFDNAYDEALAGYAKNITLTLLPGNRVRIEDDGRGIPTEIHPKTKKSALETAATMLHAGGKFNNQAYKVSGGLHGVGLSVVNALSVYMKAEVHRKPDVFAQEYKRGKPLAPVKRVGATKRTGTIITFEPDPEIFKEINYEWEKVVTHLRQQAYLIKGIRVHIIDERSPIKSIRPENQKETVSYPAYTFYFEGGIVSFIQYFLNRKEEAKHPNIFYVSKEQEELQIEVAFQYTDDLQGKELGFANNIHTLEGGMHITGFRSAITRTLNDFARKNGYLKEKEENLTGEDVREGLTAVVSVKLREPQFEGQTKGKLGNPEARTAVESVLNVEIPDWLERNPTDARGIMEKVLLASKARIAAKAARDTVIRKGSMEGFTLPGKLADCSSRDPIESELFIVEGDSAGGCFLGDTKVALLDGRNISFEELVKEDAQGKKNYCYTIDKNGNIIVAPILNPRLTKKNTAVIKVVLDNEEEIICTPDHKFMLRDGTYKEVQYLNSGDSLMPLYRQFSKIGRRITIKGYELVFNHADSRWIFTHLLSDKYNFNNGIYSEISGAQRHHKDFNKLNNNPDNIVRMSKEDHFKLHQEIANTVLRSPEVLEKLRKIRQTPEYKNKVRKSMLKIAPLLSMRAKKQWENQEYKKYMIEKFLDFYNSNQEYREKNNQMLNKIQKEYWNKDENRKKQSETTKNFFENHPEKKLEYSEFSEKQWQDEALKQWRSQKTKEQWSSEFREKRKQAYNKTYLDKALVVFRSIYDKEGKIDLEKYNQIRKETRDKALIRYETILSRFFNDSRADFSEAVQNYNHKVKEVVKLDQLVDVYDLEVPDTHNFALASGVFVHNSSKQGRDRHTQAILPLRGKPLNVEKARIDRMLTNEEIRSLVIAIGTAIAEEFNISKLRYHKIVIMTDADVDGSHIRTLLLTLFYRYFPQLILAGHIYIAQPPLYRIQKGSQISYAYNDQEKEKVLAGLRVLLSKPDLAPAKKKGDWEVSPVDGATEISDEIVEEETTTLRGVSLQRYKGLGEMNPEQLWETTMNPDNRILLKVTMTDAEKADEIFDTLMGSEVMPRKKFIQTHAKNVKNLDV